MHDENNPDSRTVPDSGAIAASSDAAPRADVGDAEAPEPVLPVAPDMLAADAAPSTDAAEDRGESASDHDELEVEPPPPTDARRFLPLAIAAAVPLAFFFLLPPLTKSGLWDPYELNVADLARRVALNLHGAASLALDGADNSLPHLNDLGRPQLPFTSIALGFKLFGLHEWAGRAPLALWGLAGVLATYAFVARLVDRRAGVFSAIALTTMPLYFVQARTMLGDVVAMASVAMAFGGLAVATFDRDAEGPTPAQARVPWILLAVIGLACGFESRGGILGIAVPALAVGSAWAITWSAGARTGDRRDPTRDTIGDVVGALALVAGAAALSLGLVAMNREHSPDLNLWVGAALKTPGKYPTFDFTIGHLGHALAPWSAFIPLAVGRLFIAPVGRSARLLERETIARVALLVGAAIAVVAHGLLAARTDLIAFTAPAILAAICGVAIRDFDRGAHASVAVGVAVAVLLALFHHDFHEIPDKAYQAFAVSGAPFPESFKEHSLALWWAALGVFAVMYFFSWIERNATRAPFDIDANARVFVALRTAWDGLLALAYFAMVAGASLAGLAIWIGVKYHAKWMPQLSLQVRDAVLNAWWVIAFVPILVIFGCIFASDLWLWAFGRAGKPSKETLTRGFEPFENLFGQVRSLRRDSGDERWLAAVVLVFLMVVAIPGGVMFVLQHRGVRTLVAAAIAIPSGIAIFLAFGAIGEILRGRRASFLAVTGVLAGLVLCVSFYPALANQLSPKEVFESYQRKHTGNEPLALFGVGGRTAAYYAGGQPPQFHDTASAFTWLTGAEPNERRWMAIKAEELPKLNELYREQSNPRRNLPVIDARSSQILLVASKLGDGEKNENPLEKVILSSPPNPVHKLDVNMEDKLQVLGYDIVENSGQRTDVVVAGRAYRMRTYYKVLAPVTTEWEAFIHIDGSHRRHNGDHKPMEGKYPFALWLKDDLLVDDYEFKLEPNFTQGNYTVFFGLFVGDTRLKVKSGPSDGDNRINGGTMRVQ